MFSASPMMRSVCSSFDGSQIAIVSTGLRTLVPATGLISPSAVCVCSGRTGHWRPAASISSAAKTLKPPPPPTTATPGPAGEPRIAEGDGEVDDLLDAVDADGVDLAAEGVEHLERAGEAGGMRHNGARAGGRSSALENDRGLGGGSLADRLDKAAAVFDPLDVGSDDLRLRVVREVAEQLALVDVGGVAVADDLREADAADGGGVDHLARVPAALRDEADGAGLGREAAA